ncbi:MAG TPA: S53 family peptidase [Candidatus Angelobacter sp.]|jgi:subtilase family serine protease|nr:S53 family peptidase [Candidatus Angelobacter sp.]
MHRAVRRCAVVAAAVPATLASLALPAGGGVATAALVPLSIEAPDSSTQPATGPAACTAPTPDPSGSTKSYANYHCYTPQDIAAAYGVDQVHATGNMGQGQTIVLVDAYGSPTAAADLQKFYTTFYMGRSINGHAYPAPAFDEVYPQGQPDYSNTGSNGLSGPSAAAGWSGEATLDIEWSYAIAPAAHIVLLAVPPAETEGVQGFPNLFNAMSAAIDSYPAGTIFSQSFGVTEPTFGGAAQSQTAKFDAVYQKAAAKGDTVLASSGDNGTTGVSKQHKDTTTYSYPTVGWPASSPWVTAVGGTQLQHGWTWAPTTANYYNWTSGGNSEAVWNEAGLPAASGGGPSAIYPRPAWQNGVAAAIGGNARGVPDLAWNAAVNGGVLVWITAFPSYQRPGWHVYGGTSAGSPQTGGVVALVNTARAALGKGPIGHLAPILYTLPSSDFSDVVPHSYGSVPWVLTNNTDGANPDGSTPSGGVPGWPTTAGWDMTTGFGTPAVPGFVGDLAAH